MRENGTLSLTCIFSLAHLPVARLDEEHADAPCTPYLPISWVVERGSVWGGSPMPVPDRSCPGHDLASLVIQENPDVFSHLKGLFPPPSL